MTSWISIDSLPWRELRDQCLAGHERAWMTLVTTIGPKVGALFSRMGRDPETSRDLVQCFFLKLLADNSRLLREFDPDRGVPFPLYLRVIAVRVHIDWTRTREAKDHGRRVPLAEIENKPAGRDPSEELVAREILETLQGMPPRDRIALELRASGASYEEIARIVGMTSGGVSATISRARLRLRGLIEGDPRLTSGPARDCHSDPKESSASGRTPK